MDEPKINRTVDLELKLRHNAQRLKTAHDLKNYLRD